MLSKLLNFLGTILMVGVLLTAVPTTVPKLLGYQIYGILTGSMEPEYPVGCVVYVKEADFSQIQVNDVITYRLGTKVDAPATHRVVKIDTENREFITKGDANGAEDITPVAFDRVIGKVTFSLPYLGYIAYRLQTPEGLAAYIAVFLITMLLWGVSARIKKKENET